MSEKYIRWLRTSTHGYIQLFAIHASCDQETMLYAVLTHQEPDEQPDQQPVEQRDQQPDELSKLMRLVRSQMGHRFTKPLESLGSLKDSERFGDVDIFKLQGSRA